MWGKRNIYSLLAGGPVGAATMEISVWRFLKLLEIDLPQGSAIPLLGIHSQYSFTCVSKLKYSFN